MVTAHSDGVFWLTWIPAFAGMTLAGHVCPFTQRVKGHNRQDVVSLDILVSRRVSTAVSRMNLSGHSLGNQRKSA